MSYIFAPEHLHQVAKSRVGLPHKELIEGIIQDLYISYGGHIERQQHWIFSIAGGAVGIMTVLHGSLSEYVILFGTSVGTYGFSGRYRGDIYDFVLAGEMWTFTEDNFGERRTYRPGDVALLKRRQAKGFRLLEGCWMLEYGRGSVPSMLPFALSGAVIAMDFTTIWKTLWQYGRLVVKELGRGKI